MASKINKKRTFSIEGIMSINEDGAIVFEVEDFEYPVELARMIKDFEECNCKLTLSYAEAL